MKKIETVNGRVRVKTVNEEASMTQQQFKDQVNVNNIIRKYKQTGQISHLRGSSGVFGDFTQIGSYQEMLDKVINARNLFEQLPSELRTRFQNNPQALIDFLDNPANDEEAIELGLRVGKEIDTPVEEPAAQPIAKSSKSKPAKTEEA